MSSFLICGEREGLKVVWTFCHFDEYLNSNVCEWTYGYNEKSWLTEEEAVYKAEALISSSRSVKNIQVKQLQGDGSWIVIDLQTSPYAYHNKKAPK